MKQHTNPLFTTIKDAIPLRTCRNYSFEKGRHKLKPVLILLMLAFSGFLTAQTSVYSSAGNGAGTGGSFAYNLGEVVFLKATGAGGTASSCILMPIEFYKVNLEDELKLDQIHVFPSIVNTNITIDFNTTINPSYQIKLINMNGQVMYMTSVSDPQITIDMAGFSSGPYLIQIITQDSVFIQTFKIIKN